MLAHWILQGVDQMIQYVVLRTSPRNWHVVVGRNFPCLRKFIFRCTSCEDVVRYTDMGKMNRTIKPELFETTRKYAVTERTVSWYSPRFRIQWSSKKDICTANGDEHTYSQLFERGAFLTGRNEKHFVIISTLKIVPHYKIFVSATMVKL